MNTSVIIGDSFTLTCVAEGGTITWERDNVLVGNGLLVGYDLVFMEALPDHTGIYECIARNGSEETRAAATVTVSCKLTLNVCVCVCVCVCSQYYGIVL